MLSNIIVIYDSIYMYSAGTQASFLPVLYEYFLWQPVFKSTNIV